MQGATETPFLNLHQINTDPDKGRHRHGGGGLQTELLLFSLEVEVK